MNISKVPKCKERRQQSALQLQPCPRLGQTGCFEFMKMRLRYNCAELTLATEPSVPGVGTMSIGIPIVQRTAEKLRTRRTIGRKCKRGYFYVLGEVSSGMINMLVVLPVCL